MEIIELSKILVPLSIIRKVRAGQAGVPISYRVLYVFGIRIAYWTTDEQ
jgi:hypothetical protein